MKRFFLTYSVTVFLLLSFSIPANAAIVDNLPHFIDYHALTTLSISHENPKVKFINITSDRTYTWGSTFLSYFAERYDGKIHRCYIGIDFVPSNMGTLAPVISSIYFQDDDDIRFNGVGLYGKKVFKKADLSLMIIYGQFEKPSILQDELHIFWEIKGCYYFNDDIGIYLCYHAFDVDVEDSNGFGIGLSLKF